MAAGLTATYLESELRRFEDPQITNNDNPEDLHMKPIVLVGHTHDCPIHGLGTVTSGAAANIVNGRPVARVGDTTSCGAVIETGSPHYLVDGRCVARLGDTTSHGGTLIEGDSGWLVN